ncbi:hypothetical protein PX554_15205 [Sphingomonas sp. H39-1-10]|nr:MULTISPECIES: hypothetical protein [Sphingomonas]MDF0489484.1 hypothetical protein [Sphingomonas pollutisoli]SDA29105.1 hypothetical protein SAMN03159340_02306 [Sphingomonas sp. NFR15]
MESNLHYYTRRAMQEHVAARTAVTEEARKRRLELAQMFEAKLVACRG